MSLHTYYFYNRTSIIFVRFRTKFQIFLVLFLNSFCVRTHRLEEMLKLPSFHIYVSPAFILHCVAFSKMTHMNKMTAHLFMIVKHLSAVTYGLLYRRPKQTGPTLLRITAGFISVYFSLFYHINFI